MRAIYTGAFVVFALIWFALLPARLAVPAANTFSHDPGAYNRGAVNIVRLGMYSMDGQTPSYEREPGYSAFLASVYALFGIENRLAIFAMQGLLYCLALGFFIIELRRHVGDRVAIGCLIFLVLLPPMYHAVFSAYREGYALALFLVTAGALLRWQRTNDRCTAAIAGLLLGVLLLTYTPYLFLPIFLIPLLLSHKRFRKTSFALLIVLPYLLLGLWGIRNTLHTGHFVLMGNHRSTIMWHVRGEQAEHLRGLEPLRCLWAEYISRDWSNRSPYCSYTGVYHVAIINGLFKGDLTPVAREGQQKILQFFPYYLWFSLFEILEFHLPYVNGWGFAYNALAALATVIMYVGAIFSVSSWRKPALHLFLLIIFYNCVLFALTDATPRYNIPTIFAYAVLAIVGYDRLLARFRPHAAQHHHSGIQ